MTRTDMAKWGGGVAGAVVAALLIAAVKEGVALAVTLARLEEVQASHGLILSQHHDQLKALERRQ